MLTSKSKRYDKLKIKIKNLSHQKKKKKWKIS